MVPKNDGKSGTGVIDLQMEHICKRFNGEYVVDDFSLNVFKGELCCLLGPSGCGKSTTLKIIAGLLEANNGTVRLAERDITNLPAQRRKLGMVFQNYALFPHMNIFDNVAYGLRRRRVPGKDVKIRVEEALRLVRLNEYEKRRIHEISGGEQQRVALARALVIEPKALLLDEPLSNLDARLRADMRDEIRRIQRSLNMTTLYVTHDQEEAMSMADRIVIMNRGVIEQIGSPHQIYNEPASLFVADFIGQVNTRKGTVLDNAVEFLGHNLVLPSNQWPPGTTVQGTVRPERIRLVEAGNTHPTAVIIDSVFLGAVVRYLLRLDGEYQSIMVDIPSPRGIYEIGQRVGLEISVENVHFFQQQFSREDNHATDN